MSRLPNEATAEAADLIESRVQCDDLVPAGVRVLVVDAGSATLAITSGMLRMLGYKVLTAKSTGDALSIIQERQGNLDLILTEIHLPDADKFDVLEKLGRASTLPVIIMTADNDEKTMLRALLNGASLYLLKPISKFDIRDIWQFSFVRKRDQLVCATEDSTDQDSSEEEDESDDESDDDEPESNPILIGEKRREAWLRKRKIVEADGDEEDDDQLPKKTKLIWTNELHDKFLRAIRLIGIDRAHPKKILQLMNVPGVRKESVSSHLQKFRLSLKRDQDAILKMLHPESHHLSSTMHLQGLISFSELHLQEMATTNDSHLPSCFQSNAGNSLMMAHRHWEPQFYSNQTPNPITNPLFMPSNQPSRSSFHTGIKFTGEKVVDTANVLSTRNDSRSIVEMQSSRTGDPPAPKEAAGGTGAGKT